MFSWYSDGCFECLVFDGLGCSRDCGCWVYGFMVGFVLLCCVWLDLVVQAIWCVMLCCLFAWCVVCFDCLCLW